MDFLARAERRGIKVHIFLPGLHPLYPNFTQADNLIQAAHLPESAAFFAYDVGWEVHVGYYSARKEFDRLWRDWVVDRYGSVPAAERDWNYQPERVGGGITGPRGVQLVNDGDWRVYVAAYRRFWDDEISKRYRLVKERIRTLDTHHLICARSGYGGTGSMWIVPRFPFDLASGAKHLDFTSPEGYGLRGDRLGFLKGGLNTLYGRFVSGGKPVYWAEYGLSIWPHCDAKMLEQAREYYQHLLAMTYDSHANGSAGWWWPGGLRVDEVSDYGIIEPDGTPRPAALQIQKFADKFMTPRKTPEPDYFLTVDRDRYVAGYAGIFNSRSEDYAAVVDSGNVPGLKTDGTGTTSANTPLVAVGNGREVKDDAVVDVQRGAPVHVEVSVGNIAEATWLAPEGTDMGPDPPKDAFPLGRSLAEIQARGWNTSTGHIRAQYAGDWQG